MKLEFMKKKVAFKFIVPATVFIFLITGIMGFVIAHTFYTDVKVSLLTKSENISNNINSILNLEVIELTNQAKTAQKIVKRFSLLHGNPQISGSANLNGQNIPNLIFGQYKITNDIAIVDEAKTIAGGTATIFVKNGSDFVRISTNVQKNGTRAVGTVIDPQSEAYKALISGLPYYGISDILGNKYLTGYEPIKNNNGEVIGVWYAGFPFAGMMQIKNKVENSNISNNGFVALLDKDDKLIFSAGSYKAGEIDRIIKNKNDGNEDWTVNTNSDNQAGFTIISAYPDSDYTNSAIDAVIYVIIFTVIIAWSFVFFLWYLIKKQISIPIDEIRNSAVKLASGNLNSIIKIDREDEFGELADAFNDVTLTMNNIAGEVNLIIDAATKGKLDVRGDSRKFKGSYGSIIDGLNNSLDAVVGPLNVAAEYMDRISKGDIPPAITDTYFGDFNEIKQNINTMIDSLNSLVSEIKSVSKLQADGDIEAYAEPQKFIGAYREVVSGYNDALQCIHGSVAKILTMTIRYGEGDFSEALEQLPGKQIVANKALDSMRDNLLNVSQELNTIVHHAKEGKLDYRGNSAKFKGTFALVIDGVNEVLDSVIAPLNVAAEYVDRISKGDMPPLITEEYKGDFNEIKHNINTMIMSLSSLVNEINTVSRLQEEGDIDAYANPDGFTGVYKDVIAGYNAALKFIHGSIAKILTMTIRYGKGDLSETLELLPGKQIVGNQALDSLRDNLLNVAKELSILNKNAQLGKLDYRADSSQFTGSFKEIVVGTNQVLDSIISPLNVAAEYVDRISKGDMPPKITEEYSGDFNEIKNNLNSCIDIMKGLADETQLIISEVRHGNLTIRGNDSNYCGAWKDLVKGINQMLDEISQPVLEIESVFAAVSVNDFTHKITKEYKGKWADLKASLNSVMTRWIRIQNIMIELSEGDLSQLNDLRNAEQMSKEDHLLPALVNMMSAIELILIDTNKLSEAAVNGVLDVRSDVSKHSGEYAKVMEGINNTLDSLISPMNLAMDFLQKVGAGENLEIIDKKEYVGEYRKLVVNINRLSHFINSMLNDTAEVAKAAINGDLSSRIDGRKYIGNWNIIVKGFNNTLDSLTSAINMSGNFLKKVSKGEDLEVLDENSFKGHYKELAQSINILRNFLYGMIDDTTGAAQKAVNGDLSARIDLSRYPGGWNIITRGFNDTLDAVIEPIEEAINTLSVLSTGDLTARMTGDYHGDHKKLMDSINILGNALNNLICEIMESVENTASAAVQITSTADTIASGAHEQSAQTEEVASAVEEMSKTIAENADNAVRTSNFAKTNESVATEGGQIVELTVKKMRDIATVVQVSAKNIEQLGESSKQIGEIISVIDDIADQTNLLALNAAIEAARAGEQGRGFAVVADEVRKLAERTTEATKKIAVMIKSIQLETDSAVNVMHNGNNEVISGIELADNAGKALKEIVKSSQEVMQMINQIASANEQQAATSEQIAKNISAISDGTIQSAQKIHEIALSSDDLSKLTEGLRLLTDKFKVIEANYGFNGLSSPQTVQALNPKSGNKYLSHYEEIEDTDNN